MNRAIACTLVSLLNGLAYAGPATRQEPSPRWYGIYLRSSRIGYATVSARGRAFHGKAARQTDTHTWMRLKVSGSEVTQVTGQSEISLPDGTPLQMLLSVRSGNHESRLDAFYTPTAVECTVGDGPVSTKRTVRIPAGVSLRNSDEFSLGTHPLRPGASWSEADFDPTTLSIERITSRVLGRAPGKEVLWRVESHSSAGILQLLVEGQGEVIRAEMPGDISIIRETEEAARMAAQLTPGEDAAESLSLPADIPIPRPRQVSALSLVLSGIPEAYTIPQLPGQRVARSGPGQYRLEVAQAGILPLPDSLSETEERQNLESTPEISASSPEIAELARSILGQEGNRGIAVQRLQEWVHAHVSARAGLGVLRSGVDVLHTRAGLCRDDAVLYASLARAAGIPTRICAGLVCLDGRFYYHAWNESFLRSWVRVDPTFGIEPVDATHITLAVGDARCILRAADLVGAVHLHLLSVQP